MNEKICPNQPQECVFIEEMKSDIKELKTLVRYNHIDTRNSLDKITESLIGNGKVGLKVQVDRLENWTGTIKRLLWIILTAIVVSGVGLSFAYQHNKSITVQQEKK